MKLTHTTYKTVILHDISPSVSDTSEESVFEIECEPEELPLVRQSFISAGFGDIAPVVIAAMEHAGARNPNPPRGKKHDSPSP